MNVDAAQTILAQVIAGVEKDNLHPQQKANLIKIAEEEFGKFTKMDPVAQEIYLSEMYDRLYGSKKDPNLVGSIGVTVNFSSLYRSRYCEVSIDFIFARLIF